MDVQQYQATMAAYDAARPVGSWANAPSLAATNVDMVNTSGHVVEVNVTGGTVTALKVNGSAPSGSPVSGKFRIRRNGTLNITYSAAPTVQWTYAD